MCTAEYKIPNIYIFVNIYILMLSPSSPTVPVVPTVSPMVTWLSWAWTLVQVGWVPGSRDWCTPQWGRRGSWVPPLSALSPSPPRLCSGAGVPGNNVKTFLYNFLFYVLEAYYYICIVQGVYLGLPRVYSQSENQRTIWSCHWSPPGVST